MVLPGLSGSKQHEKSTRYERGHKGRTQDLNMGYSFKHGAFVGDDEAVVSTSKKNGGGASLMAFFKRKKETVRNEKRKKIRIGISNIFSSNRKSN
ncbi:hypothetical protein LIER_03639 [Lithospermum erythrorhizon]|uniref:Uncharacterized protein n=1 Tax=Lithospermum erythrorhizon TaxID=34254 RepID=A0AAV3NVJ1_LITER